MKATEKGSGLTPAERKAERAPAAAGVDEHADMNHDRHAVVDAKTDGVADAHPDAELDADRLGHAVAVGDGVGADEAGP
jgi:hypothetical protein